MPGLVIDGKEVQVPGLKILNWNDDSRLKRGPEDGKKRPTNWVRNIILHTTKGIPGGSNRTPQHIKQGGIDKGKEFDVAKFWSTDPRQSGAHLIIDTDGSVGCIADLQKTTMFHAGNRGVNYTSIGIEIYQMGDAGIYEASLSACVTLVEFLCRHFGIQRQVQWPYHRGPVGRLSAGGQDCIGVFGHRDVTRRRGLGDPGDFIMEKLIAAGFEPFDLDRDEDKQEWKVRQDALGIIQDGIPGPTTVASLKEAGYAHGLWTLRRGTSTVVEQPPVEKKPEVPVGPELFEYYQVKFSDVELDVAIVQHALMTLGHYTGELDGKSGPKTKKALEDFQQEWHLSVDGIVGPITGRALLLAVSNLALVRSC